MYYLWKTPKGPSLYDQLGSALESHLVVRQNGVYQTYGQLSDPLSVDRLFDSLQGQQETHEVIFGNNPQKLKFDLDVKTVPEDFAEDDFLDIIKEAICDAFIQLYIRILNKTITHDDIQVYTSCNDKVISYHLVIPGYAVTNHKEAAMFTYRMVDNLPVEYRKFVDNINKKTQNFRTLLSYKGNRMKRLLNGDQPSRDDLAESLVQNVSMGHAASVILPVLVEDIEERTQQAKSPVVYEHIIDMVSAEGFDEGLEFDGKVINNMLIYRRVRPSACKVCSTHGYDERHENDNSLIVLYGINEDKVEVVTMYCRRSKLSVTKCLSKPEDRRNLIDRHIDRCSKGLYKEEHCLFSKLPNAHIYEDNVMRAYADVPFLAVKADMRMGKSKGIKQICDQLLSNTIPEQEPHTPVPHAAIHDVQVKKKFDILCRLSPGLLSNLESIDDTLKYRQLPGCPINDSDKQLSISDKQLEQPSDKQLEQPSDKQLEQPSDKQLEQPSDSDSPIILALSARQTYSFAFRAVLGDAFKVYSELPAGKINITKHRQLVTQIESLHRIVGQRPPHLLICDEFEALIPQLDSGLHKHFPESMAIFEWLIKYSTRVVILDANLSNRAYRVIKKMRPNVEIHFHWNKFKRAALPSPLEDKEIIDSYEITTDVITLIEKMVMSIEMGRSVVLASNSLNIAEAINKLLVERFPDKKILIYTSKTDPGIKKKHFADVSNYWRGVDVLIYTPTLTAGVSYEDVNFDELYAYFTDESCDVETCRQMIGRVRNLHYRKYYLCIQSNPSYCLTTISGIRNELYRNRNSMYAETISDGENRPEVPFSIDINGNVEYYESSYFQVWMENKRVRNLSLSNFLSRMIHQLLVSGAEVTALVMEQDELYVEIANKYHTCAMETKEQRGLVISTAADISGEEASEISDKLMTNSTDQSVTTDEMNSLEKYRLKKFYNMVGSSEHITTNFVSTYNARHTKVLYKNLNTMKNFTTELNNCLKQLRDLERHIHMDMRQIKATGINSDSVIEHRDLMHDFTYSKHRMATSLLKHAGFVKGQLDNSILIDSDSDTESTTGELITGELTTGELTPELATPADFYLEFDKSITKENLEQNLRNAASQITSLTSTASYEFKRIGWFPKKSDERFFSKALKYVNNIIGKMYGISIVKLSSKVTIVARYQLRKCMLFRDDGAEIHEDNISKPELRYKVREAVVPEAIDVAVIDSERVEMHIVDAFG